MIDEINWPLLTVIPAHPGYAALQESQTETGEFEVFAMPIVGWAIHQSSSIIDAEFRQQPLKQKKWHHSISPVVAGNSFIDDDNVMVVLATPQSHPQFNWVVRDDFIDNARSIHDPSGQSWLEDIKKLRPTAPVSAVQPETKKKSKSGAKRK